MPTSGSVSSGNVTRVRPGGRFQVRTLPPRAQIWAAADSVLLGAACLISYWLTTRVLSLVYSAVIATVFVVRDSYAKSLAAALSRMTATLAGFALCLAYLAFLPLQLWGLAILVGLSVLVTALIGRPGDAITAAIMTTVVLVVAKLSPHDAWQQPILRLADTAIGAVVGLAAGWPACTSSAPETGRRSRRNVRRPALPAHSGFRNRSLLPSTRRQAGH